VLYRDQTVPSLRTGPVVLLKQKMIVQLIRSGYFASGTQEAPGQLVKSIKIMPPAQDCLKTGGIIFCCMESLRWIPVDTSCLTYRKDGADTGRG